LNTRVLDDLVNLAGELIISKSRIKEISKKFDYRELDMVVTQQELLISSLHDSLMKARLMPFDTIAHRFPRMVRDLSRQLGKKAEFDISGVEIELDRSILEKLSDPLMHLLRNSVDHGIESPAERLKKGKKEVGLISLKVEKDRENILIKIYDNGQGIDVEKVKETAIAKGIITKELVSSYSNEDILMLIYHPGFSTSEKVSNVSGRGVGMDVVKNTVESIGGVLNLETEIDRGSTFILKIPFTIAVIKSLLISLNGVRFAIPINQISKTLEILSSNLLKQKQKLAVEYGKKIIPVRKLSDLLMLNGNEEELKDEISLIITEIRGNTYGILVDELIGQEEIVVKVLNKPLETISGLSGVTIHGDGGIVLILDIFNLL